MSNRTHGRALLGSALLLVLLSLPGGAQAPDARWSAFVGCWVPAGGGTEAGVLCFRPSGVGLEMFNVVEGEVTATEQVVADGTARAVTAEGCTGSERVEFSEDGQRAFTRSEFVCSGETRVGSGVMSFVAPSEWIDVRALAVAGEPVAWAQRYVVATANDLSTQGIEDPSAGDRGLVRAARVRAAQEIEVADVEEAATRIDTRAVEVWVAAQETRFDLSGDEIVRLADSGIPESVIDVMVAVTYPDRFVVTPEGAATEADPTFVADRYPAGYSRGYRSYLWGGYGGPFYGSRFGYSRFSPFGYYGYGYGGYGGYWGYAPATIIVQPATPSAPEPRGRMVPGRGYTRDDPSSGGSSGSGASRPAASSGNDGGGGGGGGGSSSGSGDGDRRSTGRTAQPRN